MQIQLLLQTIIVPFLISAAAFKILNRNYSVLGILAAWLVSYFWILERIPLVPEVAEDLLWLYISFAILAGYFLQQKLFKYGLLSAYIVCIIFISWPVLRYEIDIQFIAEMLVFVVAAYIVISVKGNNNRPAFTAAMGFSVVAVITALSGSLLIGQLAGSVAAAIGFFALLEIKSGLKDKQMQDKYFTGFTLLYFLILYIARVFAEVDLYVVAALLAAGLLSLFARKNLFLILSICMYAVAVIIMLSQGSASSYY